MADLNYLVGQIKGDSKFFRVRQAKVIAVNSDYTINIQIAGDTNTLPSVKYFGHYAPRPNDQVWVITDGQDVMGLGHLAPRSYPVARLALSVAQSIGNNSDTAVVWASQTGTNPWGMWTSGANVTVPIPGYYTANFWGVFAASATGIREATIQYSTDGGSTWTTGGRFRASAPSAGQGDVMATMPATSLAAGNLIRVIVNQTSGGALDLNSTARFSIQYHGPVE